VQVGVIGAGLTGLTAAHRLAGAGHRCDVYERWPGLGGQAATLDVGDGVLLERYYHHLFTSDRHIAALYEELGMPDEIEWLPSSVAMFSDGRSHSFTSPLDLLRYRPLSLRSRIRLGAVAAFVQRRGSLERFERFTAREWVVRAMGQEAWDKVWGPLMRGKFAGRADEISMVWLWSRLRVRRQIKGGESRQELLGYPRGSWERLFEALRSSIEGKGGRVLIDAPAARLEHADHGFLLSAGEPDSFRRGHDPRAFTPAGEPERYDAVLATVPSDVFEALLSDDLAARLAGEYMERVRGVEYQAALCMLLELDRSFSPFYWTNIADPALPFVGLVEQTNLVEPARYGGRRFLYVANYVERADPLLALSPDDLLKAYEPGLRRVNPEFSTDWVRRLWVFQEPSAQPTVTVGYGDRIPPIETPVPGLLLANTTQVYPEDRGTNYAVRLGEEAAAVLESRLPAVVPTSSV
jgi:protoporphyrinogen oxidase